MNVEAPVEAPVTEGQMIVFSPNEVGELGNKFLLSVVAHEIAREEALETINKAQQVESFIDVELTKAALFLHKEERVDLFKIYGSKTDSSVLYRAVLTELGVLSRRIDDSDNVIYEFTDPQLRNTFYFDDVLKEKDEAEYRARRSRRNSLNIRLARVCKAAVAMFDAGADHTDIVYKEDPETKQKVPVITKGPKEVLGSNDEVVIRSGPSKVAEGATTTPTISGLAKLADHAHKAPTESKAKAEQNTRKDGEGSNATSEEDFLATANVMMSLVKNREGEFSTTEKTALRNLLTIIKEAGIK